MAQSDDLSRDMALWIIRLNVDDAKERQAALEEFEQWKLQHQSHLDLAEWNQLQSFSEEVQQYASLHQLSAETVHEALETQQQVHQQTSRVFGQSILGLIMVVMLGYFSYAYFPYVHFSSAYGTYQYYFADLKTAVAETRTIRLEDGSQLVLGAKSAVNIDFNQQRRSIELLEGEIYIDVAKDLQRPLIVESEQAQFKALGTRFLVQQYPTHTQLDMLHSRVEVQQLQTAERLAVIQQGQRISIDATGQMQRSAIEENQTQIAWQQGQIIAENLALSDLLHQLNLHSDAYLFYRTADLKALKINGIIDRHQDIEATLMLIAQKHPQLKIKKLSTHIFILY